MNNILAGSDLLKEKILITAYEIFTQKGFNASTMEDIRKQAGCNEGELKQYFGYKEEVFLEIVKIKAEQQRQHLKMLYESSSPENVIHDMLTAMFQFYQDEGYASVYYEFHIMAGRCPNIKRAVSEMHDLWKHFVKSMLTDFKSQGLIKPDTDAEKAAAFIIATFNGYNLRALADPTTIDIEFAINMIKNLLA